MKMPQKKIKIVYLLPTLDKGGAERMVVDLILNLDRSIFEPTLILFKRGGGWLTELATENIPVVILEKRKKIDLSNLFSLLRAIRKIQPQIVHTHLGGDYYSCAISRLTDVPVILSTEHNVNSDESFWRNILKRINNRAADEIVAISDAVKNDIVSRYHLAAQKISVIKNGVDTAKFLKAAKIRKNESGPESNHKVIFGTMGRLSPQKGHLVLIEAWKTVKPGIDCLIAGTGPLEKDLEEKIKKDGLKDRIKLIGPISDPAAFLNSLDAFVFPSIWEGLGLVLLEAGLVGLPIITSKIDGTVEIVDGETGWLVPAGNAVALAAKINWLADNLNEASVISKTEKLRKKIISNFSITDAAIRYQALYRDLLKRKNLSL
ncbi:MAG: glycosyltransferase [Patescibacteria group bacterium]|jgi:glycosyltransferase involved in cell wall biosynthesis